MGSQNYFGLLEINLVSFPHYLTLKRLIFRSPKNFLNFPKSFFLGGGGGDCKISWNLSLMEKFEVQLDNDLEQSKAPQVMIIFFFLKLGEDLILLHLIS